MSGGTESDHIVHLNEQDYTGVEAIATSTGGELFFAAVFDGVIPELSYQSERNGLFIGKVVAENDQEIRLALAIELAPKNLREVHFRTNYSPRDCLRGIWFEVKTLRPHLFKTIMVPKAKVTRRFRLDASTPTCTA